MQYQTLESSSSSSSSSSWGPHSHGTVSFGGAAAALDMIERLAAENAVVIFSKRSCCMCHALKQLFCGMGVNPTVYELDHGSTDLENALMMVLATPNPTPLVFIGGKLIGTMDRVMAAHINGSLVPLLKQAGALWL